MKRLVMTTIFIISLVHHAMAATHPGKKIYDQTCVVCHGQNGKGALPGVTDFTRKDGPLSKSYKVLFQHTKQGFQSPGSPMAMPPKGGNPNLTDKDLHQVLDYIRKTYSSPK